MFHQVGELKIFFASDIVRRIPSTRAIGERLVANGVEANTDAA